MWPYSVETAEVGISDDYIGVVLISTPDFEPRYILKVDNRNTLYIDKTTGSAISGFLEKKTRWLFY